VKITTARFDTWEEFIASAEKSSYRGWDAGHSDGSEDFYGTRTFEEATKLARDGWAEGAARVQSIRASLGEVISTLVAARAESIGYDVAGDYVDVGRFLSGEPECFGVRVCDESQSKPVVRINVNTAVSASVSASAIFGRGAAILAAIDVIEATGSRVEVWAVNCNATFNGKTVHETYVLIKSASQPIDIDRLAFAFCHQSSHRRLSFSVFEHYGIRAGESCPHEVSITEGINTRPARRSKTFTRQELLEEIKWICDRAGVCISQEEIDALAAA